MTEAEREWLQVSKVWYTLFCTLIDAYAEDAYTPDEVLERFLTLRRELAERVPAVEAMMRKKRN